MAQNQDFRIEFARPLIFSKRGLTRQWRAKIFSKGNGKLIHIQNETFFNQSDSIHNLKLVRACLNDLLDEYLV